MAGVMSPLAMWLFPLVWLAATIYCFWLATRLVRAVERIAEKLG